MFSGIQHIGGGKAERVHGAIRHFYRTDERRVNGRFDDTGLLRIDGFSANACRFTGANKGGLKCKIIFRQRNKQTIRRFDAMAGDPF